MITADQEILKMSRPKRKCHKKRKNAKSFKAIRHKKNKTDRCANPLQLNGHVGIQLRKLSKELKEQFPYLNPNAVVCDSCRKNFRSLNLRKNKQNNTGTRNAIPETCTSHSEHSDRAEDENCGETLGAVGPNRTLRNECEDETQFEEVQELDVTGQNGSSETGYKDFKVIFKNLKTAFSSLSENDPLRVRILTIAPDSWNLKRTANEFGTTIHYVRKARELLKNEGLFAELPNKNSGGLPKVTIDKVTSFYNCDDVSRVMPGIKDTVSMKINGEKQKVQKRLLLMSLKELYVLFKKEHADSKVCFSVFARLRPKNTILPGQSGTHCVCVCTIHQNVKMMLDAINIRELTASHDKKLNNYKDCLSYIVCPNPTDDCFLHGCEHCPGIDNFGDHLRNLLVENSTTQVKYAIWTEADRSTLVTFTEDVDDFIENLCHRLKVLRPHSYIAKKQSEFIKLRRNNLSKGEVMVCFDFSENFAYIAQDAAQSFHYNNDQCTVFPVIYYYRDDSAIVHECCIFLSDSTKHDTAAVYTILTQLVPHIQKNVRKVTKIIYISDGAKQHFKNRYQMTNLQHHKEDFGIEAEWHFTPTAHGKSGYDGLAACFKREARRASLKANPIKAILNAEALYSWAKNYFTDVKIFRFSKIEHGKMQRRLNTRFEKAQGLIGISNNHSFKIMKNGAIDMQRYSKI